MQIGLLVTRKQRVLFCQHLLNTRQQAHCTLLIFTLTANCQSAAQSDIVTITSGDLSREVEIKQLGYDFRTDKNRIVQIRDLENKSSDLNQDDYFSWMDSKLQGISPAENQGRVRNDGLHFFVGKSGLLSYTIY